MATTNASADATADAIFESPSSTGGMAGMSKEDSVLIWFDPKGNPRFDGQKMKKQLEHVADHIVFHKERKACIAFIRSTPNQKIFMVTPGLYASDILSAVSNLPQIDCLFVFCTKKSSYEYLAGVYPKIVGIYTDPDSLCASIKEQIDRIDNDLQAFSFFDPNKRITEHLSKELAAFLCFQLFKYAIHHEPANEQAKKQMIQFCRECIQGNPIEQKFIDQFEQKYRAEEALQWYLKQSFVYKMINNALRKRDIDQLYIFRFFFADISQNLAREQKKLVGNNKTMTFYRGVKLPQSELAKFQKYQGKLVSTNGFLLTSREQSQALAFAKQSTKRADIHPTLFEIQCDVRKLGEDILFADITPFSELPTENGILFDLNSVFRLESVHQEDGVWLIKMKPSNEGPSITESYIKAVNFDTRKLSFPILIGIVMCSLGEYSKSQQYFERMLADPKGEDVALIEYHIGQIVDFKMDWESARQHYDRAYELMIKAEPKRVEEAVQVLNDIGNVLVNQKKYEEALEFFRRALAMQEEHYKDGHVNIALTLNNIASILAYQDKYDEALKLYQKALDIQEKLHPKDHIDIAATLTNIGNILSLENSDKALEYHQRALKIKEKYYPSDDFKMVSSYAGIGNVLLNQEKYDEASEYFQRALQIQKDGDQPDQMDLGNVLNSMAAIKRMQEKYDEALDFLQQALKIKEESDFARPLDLAIITNNIGLIYEDKNDYDHAVECHEKSLQMKSDLPPDDPAVGISYGHLANAYTRQGRYDKAVEYRLKYLENRRKNLPADDPNLGNCLSDVGSDYEQMGDKKNAVKYYTEALALYEKSVPAGHPILKKAQQDIQRASSGASAPRAAVAKSTSSKPAAAGAGGATAKKDCSIQ